MEPILKEVVKWLAEQTPKALDKAEQLVYNCLQYSEPFMEVVKTAVEKGLEMALNLLRTIKDEVVTFCKKNETLMTELTKLNVKVVSREVILRCGVKQAIKYGVAEAGQQVVQRALKVANPVSIVADIAQAGMEYAGYEKAGKTVGMWGNVSTGAVAGAMVGGPVGFAVGALGGFVTWGAGEITGAVIHRTLS